MGLGCDEHGSDGVGRAMKRFDRFDVGIAESHEAIEDCDVAVEFGHGLIEDQDFSGISPLFCSNWA